MIIEQALESKETSARKHGTVTGLTGGSGASSGSVSPSYHRGYSEAANCLLSHDVLTKLGLIILSNAQGFPAFRLGNDLYEAMGMKDRPFKV